MLGCRSHVVWIGGSRTQPISRSGYPLQHRGRTPVQNCMTWPSLMPEKYAPGLTATSGNATRAALRPGVMARPVEHGGGSRASHGEPERAPGRRVGCTPSRRRGRGPRAGGPAGAGSARGTGAEAAWRGPKASHRADSARTSMVRWQTWAVEPPARSGELPRPVQTAPFRDGRDPTSARHHRPSQDVCP